MEGVRGGRGTEGHLSGEEVGRVLEVSVCRDWGICPDILWVLETYISFLVPHTEPCYGKSRRNENLNTQPLLGWKRVQASACHQGLAGEI